MLGAGLADDVFLQHHAPHVVSAEAEPELADLESLRDPGRLDVDHVVEEDSRNRERLQEVDGRCFILDPPAESGVLRLERPRDERRKSAAFFLKLTEGLEVIDPVLERLSAAEHHRGRRSHAELMGAAMHVDPVFGRALEACDLETHLVVENLRPRPRNRVQSGVAHPGDRVADGNSAHLRNRQDLRSGEAMQVDRKSLFDRTEQVLEIFDLQIRIDAALHQHAGAAKVHGLLNLAEDLLFRENVALLVTHRPVEGAEAAVLGAEVRMVDVAVDDVARHALRVKLAPDGVGFHADADQVVALQGVQRFLLGHDSPW